MSGRALYQRQWMSLFFDSQKVTKEKLPAAPRPFKVVLWLPLYYPAMLMPELLVICGSSNSFLL
ncbi:hypothetical protein EOD41_14135 [Mucilaginibacter limnophilus]|uniref:Uncharacterized protein n=1 Tax=Mucilaginibacter limnophilus TaxID=1932778 RepID=A0A437MR46_9SPHI|nr:hypothetical protein [Mucilaginibacter limnophilus]RVU00096.1 hypothetical protein EOD41_14135 [Mucilaginibacter limnophilus]